jgi:diguanylate cyclase (GGDEF)-like protein/PAS domain S-box-containing protein
MPGFITTRKKSAVLGSSDITRALISCASTGIYMVQEGRFIYVSPLFVQLSGYQEHDILGKKSLNLVYAADRDEVRQNAIASLKGLRTEPYEYRFIKKNGELLWTLEKTVSTEIHGKKTAVGSFMDISAIKKLEESLRNAQEFNTSLLDISSNAVMVANPDTSIRFVNHAFEEVTGYTSEELIGKNAPYPFWTEDSRERAMSSLQEVVKTGGISKIEIDCQKKTGELLWIEVSTTYRGKPPFILASWADISERKRTEAELKLRAKMLNEATDSIIVHDLNGNIIYANEAAFKIRGYTYEELMKLKIHQLITPRQRWIFTEQLPTLLSEGRLAFEADNICKDGSVIPMEIRSRIIKSDGVKLIISVARDIAERRKTEDELVHIATHDPLTGLPNRSLLNDRIGVVLTQASRNTKKFAVMMLDLDRFKYVNDQLGHVVGDKLLQTVAKLLTETLRKGDTIARFGGDEFLVLLPEVLSIENAASIASKILKAFSKPLFIDQNKINITTSIGIAVYPDDGNDADTLVRKADQSMYRAKEKGRDTFEFFAQYGLNME